MEIIEPAARIMMCISFILICYCHIKQQKYIDKLQDKVNHLGKDRVEVYCMMGKLVDRIQSLEDKSKHKKTEKVQHEYH